MNDIVTDPLALTPVQNVGGLWLKREDLFAPFGKFDVNGGKLRQCMLLIKQALSEHPYKGAVSYCSIHSPQAPITSAVSQLYGIGCKIVYGGTTIDAVNQISGVRLAKNHGAEIIIGAKTGRHNVLHKYAQNIAEREDYFLVQYGFNLENYSDVLLNAVSNQVENLPNYLENLVITCGSGITTSGVLLGLEKFGKEVENIHLVCTAPNRDELIMRITGKKQDYIRHDLYHTKGFVYENPCYNSYHGIRFHPNYEGKTFEWLKNSGIDLHNSKTCMWVVGAEPMGW